MFKGIVLGEVCIWVTHYVRLRDTT